MIDSHCHLDHEPLLSDLNNVIKRSKEIGIKKERPNPLGLPDLVKPAGWENPNHNGNHGLFTNAF